MSEVSQEACYMITIKDHQADTRETGSLVAVLMRLSLAVTLGSDTAHVSDHPRVAHPSLILVLKRVWYWLFWRNSIEPGFLFLSTRPEQNNTP